LVLHTINSRLLADSSRAQQVILDTFKEELESIAYRWSGDAKEKAERILNAALTASRDAMNKAMQDNAKMTAEAVRAEVDGALQRVSKATQEAKNLAIFNVV
ncbi:conjugal transfer protein TraM, partial [Xanthomonas euvesicatoria]